MRKFSFCFIFIFLFGSLTGCVEENILDRIGLATVVGYDAGTEEKISTTAVIREVNPEFKSNVKVVTTESDTSKGNRMKTTRKLSQKVMVGQMNVTLVGEEFAKDDIHHLVDTLLEDASVSNSLYVAVVEGETAPLLTFEYKNIDDIGQHIFKLLEQNIHEEYMISSTLHEVGHNYYSAGQDIALPLLKQNEELIEISGVALFKEGTMVDSLPAEDSFYLKLIRDTFKSGLFEMILKEEEVPADFLKESTNEISMAFDAIRSKRIWKLVDASKPEFDFHLQLKARVVEIYPDLNMGDPKTVAELEEAVSKKMEKEVSRVIALTQEVNSDVFGFGEKYRSSVRNSNLTKEKWHEKYPDIKVNVNVDFVILRDGVFE